MSEARDFYVSMRKSETKPLYMLLAGPFETHDEALKMVDPTRKEASRLDPWANFYFFGTCSKPRSPENKAGWLISGSRPSTNRCRLQCCHPSKPV